MSYSQYMRHWKNHRKDRFYQQCSGPMEVAETIARQPHTDLSIKSFQSLMDSVTTFPVYVKLCSGGFWTTTNERDSFGTEIKSAEEMRRFYYDIVF